MFCWTQLFYLIKGLILKIPTAIKHEKDVLTQATLLMFEFNAGVNYMC